VTSFADGPKGHVLVSPDKFKGSLSAPEVAAHIATGLRNARPNVPVLLLPVADGGDGTAAAAIAAGYRKVEVEVCGPTGQAVQADLAMSDDTAVIELAAASGLARLPGGRPEPLTATSYGTGQLIAAAKRLGARRIVLGLGGSACTDGGAGLIQALGGRLLDGLGNSLPRGGAALRSLHRLDLRGLIDLSGVQIVVASDVDNPLLGPDGAAAVYGPQKGASPEDIRILEAGLRRWADLGEATIRRTVRNAAGAGAAGGVGFAALAFLGARVEPGISYLLDLLDFTGKARGARLVITGRRALTGEQLRRARIQAAYALTDIEPDVERCMRLAGHLLEQLVVAVADEWLK
jgi:glycerate kinase